LEFDSANSPVEKVNAYSSAHNSLLQSGNTIVINDYVISELCNRWARIEYKRLFPDDPRMYLFKSRRNANKLRSSMDFIHEVCVEILRQYKFVPLSGVHYRIRQTLDQFCSGKLDFTDSVLIQFCRKENFYLMTDDRDFLGRGVPVIMHRP